MHFRRDEVEFYRTNGYLAGPRVLSDEEIDVLKRRIDDILNGRVPFPEHLLGETTQKSRAKGQLPSVKVVNLFRHDEVFRRVLDNPMIGALARDLMEPPVRLWEDQMIYKPPYDGNAAVAWHQDYTYWDQVGPPELGTCWIALDDATIANGCMYVIPGSHRWNFRYSRDEVDAGDPNWLLSHPRLPAGANREPVACEVKAGHCHFHHCLTFHGSFGNRTENPRRSYILHLMPGNTRRLGDSWNERQGRVEAVGIGEVVRGANYPDLAQQEEVAQ
jgi:ectoine hydroxylase-related dioxygenase (phytanoyl-CoA dioxygenase family)